MIDSERERHRREVVEKRAATRDLAIPEANGPAGAKTVDAAAGDLLYAYNHELCELDVFPVAAVVNGDAYVVVVNPDGPPHLRKAMDGEYFKSPREALLSVADEVKEEHKQVSQRAKSLAAILRSLELTESENA